jgi:hypothetical protein
LFSLKLFYARGGQPSMPCAEKATLAEAYTTATRFYFYALGLFQSARAEGSQKAYEDAKRISEEAHEQCNVALLALEKHTISHGC